VVTYLLRRQLTDRRGYTENIAHQCDDVAWLSFDDAQNLGVGNIFNRLCIASALHDDRVVIVGKAALGVVHYVLED